MTESSGRLMGKILSDMRTGQLTPSDAFTVIQGVTGDEERWQTLHDVMSSSRVFGGGASQ